MKQLFHPYWLWEDYKAGLYSKQRLSAAKEAELAEVAKNILSNSTLFRNIASRVIEEWKIASEVNLSNISRNRQAWIGQASCCYSYGIPEYVTKLGWHLMTTEQQTEANKVADEIIEMWERNHKCRNITSLKMFFKQPETE